jgi:hypothetical protein
MVAVVVVAAWLVTACGSASERAGERLAEEIISRSAGEDVDIDVDGETVTVETDEGTARFGSSALPDAFPAEMPVPDGVTVAGSFVTEGSEGTVIQAQLVAEVDDDIDRLVAFFDERLEPAGWTVVERNSMDMTGMRSTIYVVNGHGLDGVVTVQSLGDDSDTFTSLLYSFESTAS